MKLSGATFRRIEDPQAWRALAPWLTIDDGTSWQGVEGPEVQLQTVVAAREALSTEGYVHLPSVLAENEALRLSRAIAALHDGGFHPAFVYLFDQPWLALALILPVLERVLGGKVEALADVWAWRVDPRVHTGGWKPHRGWYEDVRSPTGVPSLVNVWLSLTRAALGNACMHILPLNRDPDWPAALDREPFDISGGAPLPTEPGSILVWNANALHSGGQCDPTFVEPRISLGFSVRHRGSTLCPTPAIPWPLPFRGRVDLVASMIGLYGARDLPPDDPILGWASATALMARLAYRP